MAHLTKRLEPSNLPLSIYRTYNESSKNFGLLKCMAVDCDFSTDDNNAMLEHLHDHQRSELPPKGFLDCAYCQLNAKKAVDPKALIAHVREHHNYCRFQCGECFYRSCLPGNVIIHRQHTHPDTEIKVIYECEGPVKSIKDNMLKMRRLLLDNVKELICPRCFCGQFFAISSLEKHLQQAHNIFNYDDLSTCLFACIYCSEEKRDKESMQEHLALNHPNEEAYVCKRVLTLETEVGAKQNLQLLNIGTPVAIKEVRKCPDRTPQQSPQKDNNSVENRESDSQNQQTLQVNLLKSLLVKLTRSTGVPPDMLYQCPEINCGGIFSIYSLWQYHMLARHHCLQTICPHCPEKDLIELCDFQQHFEQHRMHFYVCFFCGITLVSEMEIHAHAQTVHKRTLASTNLRSFHIGPHRAFYVSAPTKLDDLILVQTLQKTIKKRLAVLSNIKSNELAFNWEIHDNEWINDFPAYFHNTKSQMKCPASPCDYNGLNDQDLIDHLSRNHPIKDIDFECSECHLIIRKPRSWNEVMHHTKMHLAHLYVCCVCSFYHYNKQQLSAHIRELHDSRDVPVVTLHRSPKSTRMSISIVLATGEKTFSTIKKCFCCQDNLNDINMLPIHLKSAHGISLDYFCALCAQKSLKTADQINDHFKKKHCQMKISCRLKSGNKLIFLCHNPFEVQIVQAAENPAPSEKDSIRRVIIKTEVPDVPSDSEDIDLNELVVGGTQQTPVDKSAVKCVNIQNLMKPQASVAEAIPSDMANSGIPKRTRAAVKNSAASVANGNIMASQSSVQIDARGAPMSRQTTKKISAIQPSEQFLTVNAANIKQQDRVTLDSGTSEQSAIISQRRNVVGMANKNAPKLYHNSVAKNLPESFRNTNNSRHIPQTTSRDVTVLQKPSILQTQTRNVLTSIRSGNTDQTHCNTQTCAGKNSKTFQNVNDVRNFPQNASQSTTVSQKQTPVRTGTPNTPVVMRMNFSSQKGIEPRSPMTLENTNGSRNVLQLGVQSQNSSRPKKRSVPQAGTTNTPGLGQQRIENLNRVHMTTGIPSAKKLCSKTAETFITQEQFQNSTVVSPQEEQCRSHLETAIEDYSELRIPNTSQSAIKLARSGFASFNVQQTN